MKKNGTKKNAIMADKELILVKRNVNNQIRRFIPPNNGSNAKMTPKPVATPLPPLNFNQSGKQCPKIEKNPANEIKTNL